MSTYKVLQDIEAEDKLVGPLSLRQFIYAGVAAVCLYICFLSYTRGAAFLIVFFLPIAIVGTFFAFPWKGEQPTEIWALARLRFMVKPRVRIWNQDGTKDLVTVTAPQRGPVKAPQRSLSQTEVRSRLRALADTIDSRGWATRNANYQYYMNQQRQPSDRLVNAPDINPSAIPFDAFLPSNDMLDDQNPIAQNLDALLSQSQQQKRQQVMQQMAQAQMPSMPMPISSPVSQPTVSLAGPVSPQLPAPQLPAPAMPSAQPPLPAPLSYGTMPADNQGAYWFANGPAFPGATPAPSGPGAVMPADPTADEQALARQIAANKQADLQINYSHMRVLQPTSDVGGASGPGNMINYGNLPGSAGLAQEKADVEAAIQAALSSSATAADQAAATAAAPVTRQPDPAILELANNDDLDVATIARQANREIQKSPDEVEIRLH